jgi:hypothetical protein
MKIYTGNPVGPVTVIGKNQIRIAQFALRNQGWHSYGKDTATRRALQGLEALRIVELNRVTRQFRWNDTRGKAE